MEYLKPDNKPEKKKEFFVWDIETVNVDGRPKLRGIGCYNIFTDKYYFYDSFEQFWELLKKSESKVFYAHFGGRFDVLFLLQWLKDIKKTNQVMFIMSGSRIIICKIAVRKFKQKGNIQYKYVTFWDSFSIYSQSLDNLLKKFGMEFEKGKVDYDKFADDEYWESVGKPYLENDCRSLAAILYRFYDRIYQLGGKIRPTIASSSMSVFRCRYLKNKIIRNEGYNELLRFAYVGGRTEVFKHKGFFLYYYDINSLYPYVMRDNRYPTGKITIINRFREIPEDYTAFVAASVKIRKNTHIPILSYKFKLKPHRKSSPIKVIFPVGTFSGIFTYQELQMALEYDQIEDMEVHKMYIYKSDYIFKDYVTDLYNLRMSSENDLDKYTWKIFMNSLYGKFCQNLDKDSYYLNPSREEILNKPNMVPYNARMNIWKETVQRDSSFIIVSIGAQITANARLELTRKMLDLYNKGYDIYYCDTDSITTDAPEDEFNISNELGAWKLEDEIVWGEYYYPKTYRYLNAENKLYIKSKGIRITDYEEFNQFISGEEIEQKDVVRVSPVKRSIQSFDEFVGYAPVKKRSRNPSSKRDGLDPIEIRE